MAAVVVAWAEWAAWISDRAKKQKTLSRSRERAGRGETLLDTPRKSPAAMRGFFLF
jgi:hypothetical protein